MMRPGPRLLLRAVLLLGTARCSPAAPGSEWSTPGTPGHPLLTRTLPADSRPHRPAQTWGPAPGTGTAARTPEDAGREGLMMGDYRLRSPELSPASPEKIQNRSGDPSRTRTDPNRTGTDPTSELSRTGTDPSELNRTGTDPSELNRTGTDPTSELSRTGTDPSEPNRTGTDPSELNRTGTDPSELSRTGTDPSELNRTGTDSTSELNRTGTNSTSELNRTGTDPSELNRTGTDPTSELNSTGTDPSELNRTGTDPSELSRTGTDPSELIRTGTDPSELIRTGTEPSSELSRTNRPSLSADIGINQTPAEPGHTEHHLGPSTYSEPDWMEMTQSSSAAGVTPKSATQRHLNKRTPHMDTTYMSTTRGGDRTLLSLTNDSNVADITEIPDTYATNTGTHQSGNITEDSPTTAWGEGNSTEVRNTSSHGAYPLQTPAYVVTTYPSPTSQSNATLPFTSAPVTAPNSPKTTAVTPSSVAPSSDLSGTESWSSVATSAAATTGAASSSPPGEVTAQTQWPPWQVSSPAPSTSASAARSSVSPSLAETSSKTPQPPTTMSSTLGSPASPTSLPPFTESTPGDEKTPVASTSPTHETSAGPKTPQVVTEGRSHDETTPTTRDGTTTVRPMGAQTTEMSTEGESTERATVGTRLMGTPTQSIDNTPSSTPSNLLTPSPPDTTQKTPRDPPRTTGSSTLTTADREVVTQRTPQIHLNTEAPRPETTVSTKGKKTLPHPPPPSTTPAMSSTTTTATPPPTTPPWTPPTTAAGPCSSSPCHNGGLCVESRDLKSHRCHCPAGWRGDLCDTDVDECLSSPCPALSTCSNSRGSFSCQCPPGFLLQTGAGCVLVRTFLGHIEIPWSFVDGADMKDGRLHHIAEDIVRVLNSSFSAISGYYQSTVTSDGRTGSNGLIIHSLFSLESNVTMYDVLRSLQSSAKVCETSRERPPSCQLVLHLQHRMRVLSLCQVRTPGCDNETAVCADPAGVAFCQCKPGYFKYSKTDHSCRACDDGYKLENGACVRCPFGLGGFNCSNPYQLITVIIAAAGGGLLLILVVALVVTCCRKSKHDISKLIFKSGDFQMSPYAEYPKTQRSSSDWGRETIEMQENGSTKNLLQMTDVYYSPGLRNPELERNGLYPYTGLPGSRHSCIYPGQYNPSFINEENRRRDYF